MSEAVSPASQTSLPWKPLAWFGALLLVVYAPILASLASQWNSDPDMGHGFFVPVIAAYIVWQRRERLLAMPARPNWWGLTLVLLGAAQLIIATLGAELFLARTSLVITLAGMVWLLGGTAILYELAFPLVLLLFMVPLPSVVYNRITFPLQLLASQLADSALTLFAVPVLREGNILELPNQKLSVVEACSGIRSLLSLTFLSLVFGYFFEDRRWLRALLLLATVPIAIVANASRVTLTGILTQVKPELAEGFFHTASGWLIFMLALGILIVFHQVVVLGIGLAERLRQRR
jgi:exosortase